MAHLEWTWRNAGLSGKSMNGVFGRCELLSFLEERRLSLAGRVWHMSFGQARIRVFCIAVLL
jgi:hypothetical protein